MALRPDEKPEVKVTKAVARLLGDLQPGMKVGVEVELTGSNGTKPKGKLEAVVCHPPAPE
jgi:hypothetical protein